mmetsp:Transcript_32798/g.54977  ORF Transcript_32798/g.54977 Transcript_32798/m.54977 type:complete len:228 (+) Transcript_32798:271-954(+)
MQEVIEMNDFSAFLVEGKEYKKALEILNYCLTCVQKTKQVRVDTSIMKRVKASLFGSKKNPTKQRCSIDNDTAENDGSFIYRSPMRLNEEELQSHVDPELAMSSVLIFNIALSHHLLALESPQINQLSTVKRLKGALKLYELGFHMHSKRGAEGMSMNYALALINNCAHIYDALGRPTRAQKFYSHMLSSLMMMIDGGEAGKVDQLDGYLRNASRLILTDAAPAAAA